MHSETLFEKPNELRMISRRFMAEIDASLEEVYYRKGQIWLGAGHLCRELALIKSGYAVASRAHKKQDFTTMLWHEGQVLLPGYSFFHEKPSTETIWFLTDATIYKLEARAFHALQAKYDDMQFLISFYLSEALQYKDEHTFMLNLNDPKERLVFALKEYGHAFQLLTRDQQASFLNITRRTLSDLL